MTNSDLRERVARAMLDLSQKRAIEGGCDIYLVLNDAHREAADAAIAIVLGEAAAFTATQAQAFRDDAHDRKQFGDSMMYKRGLAVAAYFDQHAAAIRALK